MLQIVFHNLIWHLQVMFDSGAKPRGFGFVSFEEPEAAEKVRLYFNVLSEKIVFKYEGSFNYGCKNSLFCFFYIHATF